MAPDGRTAVTGGFDYSVISWDLASGKPQRRMIGHDGPVDAVAFLTGGRAVSAGDDRTLILWNLSDGRLLSRWRGHAAKVAALAVAPDGEIVASAGWDRRILLWDARTGTPRPLGTQASAINALAFSSDGKLLASGAYDGAITLWHMPPGEPASTLAGNGFPVNALAFSADGKLLAALGDDTVRVFDPAKRRELLRYTGHDAPVVSIGVSRDGRLAASGSSDGALEVWRAASGKTVRSIYAAPGPVWAIAFLPDGGRILAAGSDGVLREWTIATGAELIGREPMIAGPPGVTGRGAMLFRKCAACHGFDPNDRTRAGPTFWHLLGRRAGTVAGYPYSPALKGSGLVWDAATIDRLFALGPQAVAPGSKMPLQKMPSAKDRADLIEYLKRHASGGERLE